MAIEVRKQHFLTKIYFSLLRIALGLNLIKKEGARAADTISGPDDDFSASFAPSGSLSKPADQRSGRYRDMFIQAKDPYLERLVRRLYAEKGSEWPDARCRACEGR
jgi:hypothetical protein